MVRILTGRLRQVIAALDRVGFFAPSALAARLHFTGPPASDFDTVRGGNVGFSSSSIGRTDAHLYRDTVQRMDSVFGVFTTGGGDDELAADVERLIDDGREARAKRDFQRADAIRDEFLEKGIELQDTPKGTRWVKR